MVGVSATILTSLAGVVLNFDLFFEIYFQRIILIVTTILAIPFTYKYMKIDK